MNSEIISEACSLVSNQKVAEAAALIDERYPFISENRSSRSYTPRKMLSVFIRDGFVDRYKGTKLVHPAALRLLSHYLPSAFPYHKNGKMDVGHIAFWELFPTIDHINPIARGGEDAEHNYVCCSMLTNSIKSNWTLDQLEWELKPKGDYGQWDGLTGWFIQQVTADNSVLDNPYIKRWFNASVSALECNRVTL